jgi:hypothetical protein
MGATGAVHHDGRRFTMNPLLLLLSLILGLDGAEDPETNAGPEFNPAG